MECWGPQASDAAGRLLDGQQVQVVSDPSQGSRDAYGRTGTLCQRRVWNRMASSRQGALR